MEESELEEERRLAYVGITRAEEELFLTNAFSRTLYGRTQYNRPSRFVEEIEQDLLQSLGERTQPKGAAASFQPKVFKPTYTQPRQSTVSSRQTTTAAGNQWQVGEKVNHKKMGCRHDRSDHRGRPGSRIRCRFSPTRSKTAACSICSDRKTIRRNRNGCAIN